MTEREPDDTIQPVVYWHQLKHGEELPILLGRSDRTLVCTIYHLPEGKGVVCAYYRRDKVSSAWEQRVYPTPQEAESHLSIISADWHDSRGVENETPDWYRTRTDGTEVEQIDHDFVDEIGEEVIDPIQHALDTADKISVEEFLERLREEGVDI